MQEFQVAQSNNIVQVTMDTSNLNAEALVESLKRIQVEFLAQRVNFDETILELGKEINKEWWQKNKSRLLGTK